MEAGRKLPSLVSCNAGREPLEGGLASIDNGRDAIELPVLDPAPNSGFTSGPATATLSML
jgi:hypothetical protein